jgi:acyl-CoA synthetase (AMP-forming)/AMP-acid ligase II
MIFRSPYPDIYIPEIPLTHLILERAQTLGNKPALIDAPSGQKINYDELVKSIRSVAASLSNKGFRKGDVLAIVSFNCPQYAIAFHAASLLGGIVTTANPLNTEKELALQLKDSKAKYLVISEQVYEKVSNIIDGLDVKEVFVLDEQPNENSFSSLLKNEEEHISDVEINPREDLVALPYSSGTTGMSKGVMLTHYNLVSNIHQLAAMKAYGSDDVLICTVPFFHIYGLTFIMNLSLFKGATVVILPRFDLPKLLQVIQDYGVTVAPLVPPIILSLINDPIVASYDLSKMKTIFSAAAPLDQNLIDICKERFNCIVKQGYGMTEASPGTHTTPDDPDKIKPKSVGPCNPNTESKIVDISSGQVLGVHQEGEILVRGPQVMKGYLNKPEATAITIDEDGWLHTGDIGYADEDGYFYIVDRVKELIKYKGYQVAPAELEAVLLSHPAVADAAVIPCPDNQAGEIPKAFIVLKDAATIEELSSFVAERVAPYKKIREIEFIDQIPKSPSGKILRRVLIQREREKQQCVE